MKCAVTLFVVSLLVVASYADTASRLENVNIDDVLKNERVYRGYLLCLKGTGKCTPEGKELKERIPKAMKERCKDCTEKQKAAGEKLFRYVLEHKPQDYLDLEKIYDPEHIFRKDAEEKAKEWGLKFPS